jgi:hypothetical protein
MWSHWTPPVSTGCKEGGHLEPWEGVVSEGEMQPGLANMNSEQETLFFYYLY